MTKNKTDEKERRNYGDLNVSKLYTETTELKRTIDKQQQKIKELEKEIEQFKVIIVRHEQDNKAKDDEIKELKDINYKYKMDILKLLD